MVHQGGREGNSNAMFNLGLSFKRGEGVEKNFIKAVEWYTKAAERIQMLCTILARA